MSLLNKVECKSCHTFVTPIYGGECPNCGDYVSGFRPEELLREKQEEYNRDYAYLKSKGATDEEIKEILGPCYESNEDDEYTED